MHPNISVELAKKGILPLLNQEEWVSPDIPYSSDQIDKAFPNRPSRRPVAYWFRKNIGQRATFSFSQATKPDPVDLAEVEEFVRNNTTGKK